MPKPDAAADARRLRELLQDVADAYEDEGCNGCGTVDVGTMNRVRAELGMAPLVDENDTEGPDELEVSPDDDDDASE